MDMLNLLCRSTGNINILHCSPFVYSLMPEGLDNLRIHQLWRSVTLMRFGGFLYHLQDDARDVHKGVVTRSLITGEGRMVDSG